MSRDTLYRNAEGYVDRTAGAAVQNVYKECHNNKNNEVLSKKRSKVIYEDAERRTITKTN